MAVGVGGVDGDGLLRVLMMLLLACVVFICDRWLLIPTINLVTSCSDEGFLLKWSATDLLLLFFLLCC